MKRSTLVMATSTPSIATVLAPIVSPWTSTSNASRDSPTRAAVASGALRACSPWAAAQGLQIRSGTGGPAPPAAC